MCTNAGANLNAFHNSNGEFSVTLHFLTAGLLNRLYFRYVCCLIQFFSQNSRFSQTELCSSPQISLYAFDFIKFCVSVIAHSLCLLLPILLGLLLSILRVCYCPFCGSITTPSVSYYSILRVCYCPFCGSITTPSVSYYPFWGSVTAHSAGLLLPFLSVTTHSAGLLLPNLFRHVVLIPVTPVPLITCTSKNGLPLGLNIHNTSACAPEAVRVPQNDAQRPSRC